MSTVGSPPDEPDDVRPDWPDTAWVTHATGRRVTVRLLAGGVGPSGGPAMRDVVGTLQEATTEQWVVVTRDGTPRSIDPSSIVAAKVVPDVPRRLRRASDVEVATLETIAAHGWQPLERTMLGDWVLRAAGGFTGRANSVLPLGDPGVDLDTALNVVVDWYTERDLNPMIQVPLPLHAELDESLRMRGWDTYHRTHVMVSDLDALLMAASDAASASQDGEFRVSVAETPDADWLEVFRYGDQRIPPELASMLTLTAHPVFSTIHDSEGRACAIGRGAVSDDWLGITAVEVAATSRRRGLGRRTIAALAEHAAKLRGLRVRHVYLQVGHDSGPALALYRKLGFAHHHDYVYRRSRQRTT